MNRKLIRGGLMASLLIITAPVLHGATITVTTAKDELDGASGNGDCALREAVVNANANDQSGSVDCAAGEAGPGVVDEIVFASALDDTPIGLTIPGVGEDNAQTGDLDITDTLTITGRGGINPGSPVGSSPSANTEITTNTLALYDRVFHLQHDIEATFRQLWITDGKNVSLGGGIKSELRSSLTLVNVLVSDNLVHDDNFVAGGGIYADGHLVLENSAVFNNTAEVSGSSTSAYGGGIIADAGGRITQTIVAMNRAESSGLRAQAGGVRISGDKDFLIESSIIRDNEVIVTGAGETTPGQAGGIEASTNSTAQLSIKGSIIAGNSVDANQDHGASGGGLKLSRPANITNTTIANNTAAVDDDDAFGGGISAANPDDPLITLNNATVVFNQAVSHGSGGARGGGISGGPDVELANTILLGNTDENGQPDCRGDLVSSSTSNGHNIIGDNSGCGFVARLSDVVGTGSSPITATDVFDPASVGDHGGSITIGNATLPLQTVALSDSGPALDGGDPNPPASGGSCANVDQRGGTRPVDGNGDGSAVCDIGAFELGASLPGSGGNGGGSSGGGGGGAFAGSLWLVLLLGLPLTVRRARIRGRLPGPFLKALIVSLLTGVAVTGCGGGDDSSGGGESGTDNGDDNPSGSFDNATVQPGTDPKLLELSWSFSGTADHFIIEVNPDGASGFTQADLNNDGTVDTDDRIASGTSSVQLPLPVHLTRFGDASYIIVARTSDGTEIASSSTLDLTGIAAEDMTGYFKASNTDADDEFGFDVAVSGDGDTLAVGAPGEDSAATGVDGADGDDISAYQSGAVYVFVRDAAGAWTQQAYIKASNTGADDEFGNSVALSNQGDRLAVGAPFEESASAGINGDANDDSLSSAGAAYVFARDGGGNWSQQAYIKAGAPESGDRFGNDLALSGDGTLLAVTAPFRNGDTGAAYTFVHDGSNWSQQGSPGADHTETGDLFGSSIAVAGDGSTLAVGASWEDGSGSGIDDAVNNNATRAGATYVFVPDGSGGWTQQAYIKASNTNAGDQFGAGVALSGNGDTLAVGATLEQGNATGVGGDETNNSLTRAGAAYVFKRDSMDNWTQQAYIKATNTGEDDTFGLTPALSAAGNTLVVSAHGEAGDATGINGDATSDAAGTGAGAVYVYNRDTGGSWTPASYVKPPSTPAGENFGFSLSLSNNAGTLTVGAPNEPSSATGIGGDQTDNLASNAGANYLY